MSALPLKADMGERASICTFSANTDIGPTRPSPDLLPNLVVIEVRVDPGATGYEQSASAVCRDALGRHSFSRACITLAQACVSVARGLKGDLDVATDDGGCECKRDRTAGLVRHEIANDADVVSAVGRGCNGGAADLAPCDRQVRRILAGSAVRSEEHTSE